MASNINGRGLLAVGAGLAALALAGTTGRGAAVVGAVALVPLAWVFGRIPVWRAVLAGGGVGWLYGGLVGAWIPQTLQGLGSSRVEGLCGLALISLWVEAPRLAVFGAAVSLGRAWGVGARVGIVALAVWSFERWASAAWWGVPWSLLGTSQLDLPGVAQLAAVGGVPAVSALVAGIGVAGASALAGDARGARLTAGLVGAWGALALAGTPFAEWLRPTPGAVEARLLFFQPDLPWGDRWGDRHQPLNLQRVRQHAAASLAALPEPPEAVILPENLLTTPFEASSELGGARAGSMR